MKYFFSKIFGGFLFFVAVVMVPVSIMEKELSAFLFTLFFAFAGYYFWNLKKLIEKRESKEIEVGQLDRFTRKAESLYVDPQKRTWKVGLTGMEHPFDGLYQYELVEVGNSASQVQMKGGVSIGRAVVGGAIAGPAGMIMGGVTGKKKGTINTDDYVNKLYVNISAAGQREQVDIIKRKTLKTAKSYNKALNKAYEVMALLDYIQAN